jgi:DNA-binding transcriptional ArsR family regulator
MAGSSQVFGTSPGKRGRVQSIEDRVLKVISHPVRIEVLRVLHNRVSSPKELAKELGESVSNVSYHFKFLQKEDCIEMLDTEPRRGAIEHYYRAKTPPVYDEESWAKLPKAAREEISALTVRNFVGEAVRALNAGTFDANEDRRLSWMPMELDEQGWRELVERQGEWLEELERIKAAAVERLAGADTPGKRVVAGVMGFETPPGSGFTPG